MVQKLKPRKPWYEKHPLVFKVFVAAILVWIAFSMFGCAGFGGAAKPAPQVVEVPVAIETLPQAPEIVIRRYQPEALPEWVDPDHPDASSCLKAEDEDRIRKNMQQEQRIRRGARTWAGGSAL